MLVDKTNSGLVFYNHANFYRFEETSSYWSVKRISVFLCFSLVNLRHTSGITVFNRTVTNIENTVRAVHIMVDEKVWYPTDQDGYLKIILKDYSYNTPHLNCLVLVRISKSVSSMWEQKINFRITVKYYSAANYKNICER